MKKLSKPLVVLLCAALLAAVCAPAAAGADTLVISDPYARIDWDAVTAYKTALHSHTNASDGSQTLKESLQRHMETGFDIVAITDHGTVNYDWRDPNPNPLIHTALRTFGRSEGELAYLGETGVFDNGVAYEVKTENGDDFLRADNGRVLLRVPYGIENNAVSVNAHVNSWFADYADNSITTYEDAVRGVQKAGGVCVINHPGAYTKARYEIRSENAYDLKNPSYRYYVDKFTHLIEAYDACIGIDVNSKGDNRTRFDRILWDTLLGRFSAVGKNVFAIASSDAHALSVIDTGFTLALMPALTSAALRTALENGEFFAASHCLGNYDELRDIAAALLAYYGETPLYEKVNGTAQAMLEKIEGIENGTFDADEDIGITYSTLGDDGRFAAASFPQIGAIRVDDAANTVTFDTENALLLRVISDGKPVDTVKADAGATVDLDDYAGKLGDYVRFEVFGEGGVIYTQAFLLNAAEHAAAGGRVTPRGYVNLGVFDFLLAEIHKLANILRRFFGRSC